MAESRKGDALTVRASPFTGQQDLMAMRQQHESPALKPTPSLGSGGSIQRAPFQRRHASRPGNIMTDCSGEARVAPKKVRFSDTAK